MTTEIMLGGYSVSDLKKMREAVQKDAAAYIATELERAKGLFNQMLELGEGQEAGEGEATITPQIRALADEAQEAFSNVDTVATVSGVTYYVDYHTDWGYSDDKPMTSKLEDVFGYQSRYGGAELCDLQGTLESMEYDSKNWNNSTC